MSEPGIDSFSYFLKGGRYYDLKEYGQSTIIYARALSAQQDEKCYHNSANLDYMQGKFRKAIKKYSLATVIRPSFAMSYNDWGCCLSNLGKYDEAILKFKRAIEINTNYTLSYLNWGLVLYWKKEDIDAEESIEKGLRKSVLSKDLLLERYKLELSLVEERLAKAGNEEEKEFLKGRIDGYQWILELIPEKLKKFAEEDTTEESDASDEGW